MKQAAGKWLRKKCLPCEGGIPPLSRKQTIRHLRGLDEWSLSSSGKFIYAAYRMKNFPEAIRFIRKISDIAEKENHHPDLHLTGYRNLRIELMTHAIGGLSENDFILAAKITRLPKKMKPE